MALESLARLAEQSVIPKDHDKIAKAFLEVASRIRPNALYLSNLFVHLNAEKERHEKKAAEKAVQREVAGTSGGTDA